MKKYLIGLVLLLPSIVFASESVWVSGTPDYPANNATEYNTPFTGCQTYEDNGYERQVVVAGPGTISKLYATSSKTPGSGNSWTLTIYKDSGGGWEATDITCTMSDSEQTCDCGAATDTIAAGDLILMYTIPTSGPTGGAVIKWSVTFDGDNAAESIYGFGAWDLHTSYVRYFQAVAYSSAGSSVETQQNVVPINGTIRDLYVKAHNNPSEGDSWIITLMLDGEPTALTCTIADDGGGQTTCNNTSDTVAVTAGQKIAFEADPESYPDATRLGGGYIFVADTDGEFMLLSGGNDDLNPSATEYGAVHTHGWGLGSQGGKKQLSTAFTATGMYVYTTAVAGAGNSYDFALDDDTSSTSVTCQIAGDADTTCNITGESVSIATTSYLETSIVPTSSPDVVDARVSYIGYIAPEEAGERRVIMIGGNNEEDINSDWYSCLFGNTSVRR